jgi:hypothetical protein
MNRKRLNLSKDGLGEQPGRLALLGREAVRVHPLLHFAVPAPPLLCQVRRHVVPVQWGLGFRRPRAWALSWLIPCAGRQLPPLPGAARDLCHAVMEGTQLQDSNVSAIVSGAARVRGSRSVAVSRWGVTILRSVVVSAVGVVVSRRGSRSLQIQRSTTVGCGWVKRENEWESIWCTLKASRPRGLVSAIDDNALLPWLTCVLQKLW